MRHYITIFIIFLVCFIYKPVFAEEKSPEQVVKEFYEWYLATDIGDVIASQQPEMYKYFFPKTVENIREYSEDVDYVIKIGGRPSYLSDMKPIPHKAIKMERGLYVVPVTLDAKIMKHYVVVRLYKKNDTYLISSIVETVPYL